MSSIEIGSTTPSAANEIDRFQWTSTVAWLEQLQWVALEAGWVPEAYYRSANQTPSPES
jgi:hypothetical protein